MVRILVIDGEIGAGKSTLLRILVEEFGKRGVKAVSVPEPVDDWIRTGALARYYENKEMYLVEFQLYVMSTLLTTVEKTIRENQDADLIILERSVLTSRYVFFEMQKSMINEGRIEIYQTCAELLMNKMKIDWSHAKYVYLKPTIENCQRRVHSRGRKEEVGAVDSDYQTNLREAHESLFEGLHGDRFAKPNFVPQTLVLRNEDADQDFRTSEDVRDEIVAKIALHVGLNLS